MTEEEGFYALGDVATPTYNKPIGTAIMVQHPKGSDAVQPPVGFTEVWNSKGSSGKYNVRIMRMNPPEGYTALGDVVVVGYPNLPDASKYR